MFILETGKDVVGLVGRPSSEPETTGSGVAEKS
jgi:hypothetical protein